MDKAAQLREANSWGAELALVKMAGLIEEGNDDVSYNDIDKVAADRANQRIAEEKLAAEIATANGAIEWLDANGYTEAAAALSEQVQADLAETPAPAGAGESGEVTEEEAGAAAVDGAAEVVSAVSGKPKEDPSVQEAAEAMVEEEINKANAETAGGGAE